jgi:arylsulfatase A-like enzyme
MRPTRASATLLLCWWIAGCGAESPGAGGRPNVLFILIDTLRADHLRVYGYGRATSPAIDALAAEGWLFEQHVSSASQTIPATLSMLLSQHPVEHGFVHREDGQFAKNRPQYPDALLFLSEVFSAAGYATAAFVGNPFLTRENGFAQGFDEFFYSEGRGALLTAAGVRWLEERADRSRPFFAYLHFFDVHWPYDPPPAYRRRIGPPAHGRPVYTNGPAPTAKRADVEAAMAAYDGEIAYVDDQVAKLVEALSALRLRDDTIIVVTSDHGDEFLEHGGLGHGTTVYGELVRVPLVLVYPPAFAGGRRVTHLTRQIDLAPTLLETAGIDSPPRFRGHSLAEPAARAFAEAGAWNAVYAGDRKLVVNEETGVVELFDAGDHSDAHPLLPGENRDDLREHLLWYRRLERSVVTPASGAGPAAAWGPEELERLRALGYAE